MMHRYAVFILAALAMALVLSACATPGDGALTPGGGDLTPGGEPTLAPSARTIEVEAAEFSFTPNTFTAQVGEALAFEITNNGTVEHNFVVFDPAGVEVARTNTPIPVGGMASVEVTAAEVGTYTIVCDIPDHQESGMQASLTVTSAAASSDATK